MNKIVIRVSVTISIIVAALYGLNRLMEFVMANQGIGIL
jgi:hypothetical protein